MLSAVIVEERSLSSRRGALSAAGVMTVDSFEDRKALHIYDINLYRNDRA